MDEMLDNFSNIPANVDKSPPLWIEIGRDSMVTFHVPKVEMGQGIHTALAQILAEELDADWQRVRYADGRSCDARNGVCAGRRTE